MERVTVNDIKQSNKSDIFHHIYRHKKISKQKIATDLQMSLPTVTHNLALLQKQELIRMDGKIDSAVGRKATAYTICPEAKVTIGIEVAQNYAIFSLINLYGEAMKEQRLDLAFNNGEQYARDLCTMLENFIYGSSVSEKNILEIGIAFPGLISFDGRSVIYGKILNNTGMTTDIFQKYLNVPCRFFHNASCVAIAEQWMHPEIRDAIYLTISRHVGAAIMIDKKIYTGKNGRSGTIEHSTINPNGRLCYCGKKGCIETYCSLNSLLGADNSADDFFRALRRQDAEKKIRWHRFLNYLAIAINNLHMFLDDKIIIDGQITQYMIQEDLDELNQLILINTAFPEKDNYIELGRVRTNPVSRGAGLSAIKEFLDSI
ncbi:ROK family protein [Sporolactobacillus sp. KGMB 08714]|uniref:ROK family protein n=1 Tax=Sporolactobacillus sp. KGMB 08714 TaxID=3064704 RepID=UPI002FBD70E8